MSSVDDTRGFADEGGGMKVEGDVRTEGRQARFSPEKDSG
jgi:hypothetical protein